MSADPKFQGAHLPLFYLTVFPALQRSAIANGYALAVHGSCIRDFDLIAVPWTDAAVDATTLIRALKSAIGAITSHEEFDDLAPDCEPHAKPHGRIAYSLHFTNRGCHGPYVDVSIMPRAALSPATEAPSP